MPIVGHPAQVMAKQGLNANDQYWFGGYELEPPDPDIAAGNGMLVQVVNNLVGVYDQTGHQLLAPVSMEAFFGDFASFLSDPKVYFDPDTKHWFVTELMYDFYGSFDYSGVYIAVSQTGSPAGGWNIYYLDTSDPFGNSGCWFDTGVACLPDQPLLGADKWTLQISTNEFSLFGDFNGAQMFYIDKTALALGLPFPNVVAADLGDIGVPVGMCGTPWYSVQPAESPNGTYDLHWNGTSFALSALDGCNANDNRISLWWSRNTKSIASVFPLIAISRKTLAGPAYGMPPVATQPNGDIPLGNVVYDAFTSPQIQTNDDRMNEVEFNGRAGTLMGGLNTGAYVQDVNHFHAAILWIKLKIQWVGSSPSSGGVGGYIANLNADTLFPASASTNAGNGIWAYTVTGGDPIFPSAAISNFGLNTKPSKIIVTNEGVGPADGFTGYEDFAERWGDYSGAATDGNKLFATSEYIAQTCDLGTWLDDFTCGNTRGFWTNWSNSLAGVTLP
jgi:hypothetical protein